jgi:hypothetical protein
MAIVLKGGQPPVEVPKLPPLPKASSSPARGKRGTVLAGKPLSPELILKDALTPAQLRAANRISNLELDPKTRALARSKAQSTRSVRAFQRSRIATRLDSLISMMNRLPQIDPAQVANLCLAEALERGDMTEAGKLSLALLEFTKPKLQRTEVKEIKTDLSDEELQAELERLGMVGVPSGDVIDLP